MTSRRSTVADDIVAWDDSRVCRLYAPGTRDEVVVRDMEVADALWRAGMPITAVHGVDMVGDRLGIIEDRVSAPTMLEMLSARPRLAARCGDLLASIQCAVLTLTAPPELPALRPELDRKLAQADLDRATRISLQNLLETLPDGTNIVHGAIGPATVRLAEPPVLTRAGGCSAGAADADLAATDLVIGLLVPPATARLWPLAARAHRRFHESWTLGVAHRRPDAARDRWRAVMAGAMLADDRHPDDLPILRELARPS